MDELQTFKGFIDERAQKPHMAALDQHLSNLEIFAAPSSCKGFSTSESTFRERARAIALSLGSPSLESSSLCFFKGRSIFSNPLLYRKHLHQFFLSHWSVTPSVSFHESAFLKGPLLWLLGADL